MPAIVFDFDGVIVDSEPMHEAAIRAAMHELGMGFSAQDYRTRYLGFADRDIYVGVAAAHGRTLAAADFARLSRLKWEYAQAAIAKGEVPTFPGSVELLRSAASVAPVAVCSGARRQEIDLVLTRLGLLSLVPVIVTADDVARSKPDPEPYRLTVQRLGVPADACVTIEDTAKGVRSAKTAGLRVAAVCHSMTPHELAEADRIVPSTSDLSVADLIALASRGTARP